MAPHETRAIGYEELLSHSAWLRRLASALVGPSNDPDDLAQEALVAALRSPPPAEASGRLAEAPLRSWLAEVLRNAARMRARSAGRRLARDGAFAAESPDETPSPEALLERLHAQRLLAGQVAELAEPYRSTLLLHYYEGLSSAEIARMQGVPAGTVRWRLKAGLGRLKAALDDECGGDRRLWCVALLPLAGRAPITWAGLLKSPLKGATNMVRLIKLAGAATVLAGAGTVAGLALKPAPTPPAATSTAPAAEARLEAAKPAAPRSIEAQRARDAMRNDIVAALHKREAEAQKSQPAPHAHAAKAAAAAEAPKGGAQPAAPGHYDPSYIQAVFREAMFPLMRQCYENALAQKPTLAGKIALDFTIVADPEIGGVVDEAELAPESDLSDAEMATCVRESLLTLTFDKPPSGGGYVTVKYPVEFSPLRRVVILIGFAPAGQ